MTIFGAILFASTILTSCGGESIESDAKKVFTVQDEFEKARNDFYNSYENAPNEIKKSAIFIQSRKHTCEFEKKHGRNFTDWIGEINGISTDQGGDEITSFIIESKSQGCTIYYKEFGIKKGTQLYDQIAELKEGDRVFFSFKFNEEPFSTNEKECYDELSITELGSLEEPEFDVSFSNIRK